MADSEQKARQLVSEAEKKEKSSQGFFGSLFGYVTRIQSQYYMITSCFSQIQYTLITRFHVIH